MVIKYSATLNINMSKLINTPLCNSDLTTKERYLIELRNESFSRAPLKQFIKMVLLSIPSNVIFDKGTFPMVAEHYDWVRIKETLSHVVLFFESTVPTDLNELLTKVWDILPLYLEFNDVFHDEYTFKQYPLLTFMHNVLVHGFLPVVHKQIIFSTDIKAGYYFSLDSGIVTRRTNGEYTFGHLMSKLRVKLVEAEFVIHEKHWKDIDISAIVERIHDNSTSDYYNISTETFTDNISGAGMCKNDDHKIIANISDVDIFNHIVNVLYFDQTWTDNEFNVQQISTSQCETYMRAEVWVANLTRDWRDQIWDKYFENLHGNGFCWCCDDLINHTSWNPALVIPISQGGRITMDNLRPLCGYCYYHMDNQSMSEIIYDNNMKGKGGNEFCHKDTDTDSP